MKMVYIASPLRGDYNKNIENAVEYCKLACELGVLALAPHIIFSQWCNDTNPVQRVQGLQLGLSLLSKSEELWVMGTQISEGMRGEIIFAQEHGIPTFHVEQAHDPKCYPVSADDNTLLCSADCIAGSRRENYEGQTVILQYNQLKPEYRTPINQLWTVTHGPGCRPNYIHSDTVHLCHPIDGDRMAIGRGDIYGIVKPNVLEQVKSMYPAQPEPVCEQDEDFCQ